MKNWKFIVVALIIVVFKNAHAKQIGGNVENLNWNGIDVVYLEDNKFPSFAVEVYFADGALSDSKKYLGETQVMFSQLTAGTNRYDQKQLADALEYYGSSFSYNVTHEYSTINSSGLVKDIDPTLKMVCHMMTKAIFPKKELKKFKDRTMTAFKDMITNHGALADRAFRQLSLKGTIYQNPTSGYLKTIKRNSSTNLKAKLNYFNHKVKKKVYITGPRSILNKAEKIFTKDCNWSGTPEQIVRTERINPKSVRPATPAKGVSIVLIPVPKANQAKVRIGRFLDNSFAKGEFELMSLASAFMGEGFTSVLMQQLRVKQGLTYGVYAYAATQKHYGRAGISTSTKNETVFKIIDEAKKAIDQVSDAKNISAAALKNTQNFLSGSYLFKFERSSAYLGNLLFFDHIGRNYQEMFKFPEIVSSYETTDLARKIRSLFSFDNQVIVVVGNKSLRTQLSKLGKVTVMGHKGFL
jgi:zinc protease